MADKRFQEAIQRTLIVTLGELGETVGRRVERVLDEGGHPPVVAVQHIDGAWDDGIIDDALRDISRLSHRATLRQMGYRDDRLRELVIWTVGTSDQPLSDVTRQLADRAAVLLGVEPLTLGLILHDTTDETKEPAPLAVAQETQSGKPPPFTGPCYIVSPVDETGLVLDDEDALIEQAAYFVALHACTSLRDAPVWIEQASGWSEGMRSAAFGLRKMAWPGDVAQARAAHALGRVVLERLLGQWEGENASDALLRSASLAPALLAPRLIPRALASAIKGVATDPPSIPPWALLRPAGKQQHPLVAELEAIGEEVPVIIEKHADGWDPLVKVELEKAAGLVCAGVAQALDRGGVRRTRTLIEGLSWRLDEWIVGAEQRRIELEEDLKKILDEAETVRGALATIINQMPHRNLRAVFRLLRNPLRWIRLWMRWRKANDLLARHHLLTAAVLETRATMSQMTHAAEVYLALGDAVESASQKVDQMEEGLYALFHLGDLPAWPDSSARLMGDAPDEVLNCLMEQTLPPAAAHVETFVEQWGPLSNWSDETTPEKGTIHQWLHDQAAPLGGCSVWDVARCRFAEPDAVRYWIEAWIDPVYPQWRWDPAALSESERTGVGGVKVFLGAPNGARLWEDDGAGPRVLPLARSDRVAVVALRWGIPNDYEEV